MLRQRENVLRSSIRHSNIAIVTGAEAVPQGASTFQLHGPNQYARILLSGTIHFRSFSGTGTASIGINLNSFRAG